MDTPDRGVCFDFNGVIVDDERHHCAAIIETLREEGIALDSATYYRDYLGYDDIGCFRHAWRETGRAFDPARLDHLMEAKGARYRALLDADLTLVPGVQAFVHSLQDAGVRLAVVSAARRWEIEYVLEVAGLNEAFAGVVAAEDVGNTKPHPEGYLKGLDLLQLPASHCIVIEDSIPGLRAARAAGMCVAMLTTSHTRDELRFAEPETMWESYAGHTIEELPWNRTSP